MKAEEFRKRNIILSMNASLIGNITSNYRFICCDWKSEELFYIKAYTFNQPRDIDRELLDVIITEFTTYLGESIDFKKVKGDVVHSKKPRGKLDQMQLVVFARYEE